MTRWHYLDPVLLWLFPLAYGLHLAEETWAGEGLRAWIARVGVAPMTLPGFAAVNAVGLVLFVAGVVVATRGAGHPRRGAPEPGGRRPGDWIPVALATLVLLNAALHAGGTLLTRAYSPGLFTAIVGYVPLGGLTLLRALAQASGGTVWRGVLVGTVAQAVVSALALSGAL
jgi:hypothetical protein